MAHAPEKKAAIRSRYVFDRLSIEVAAEREGVPVSTARKWKMAAEASGDDWEKARAAASLSTTGTQTIAQLVLVDYLALHQSTVEGIKTDGAIPAIQRAEALSRLADAFQKTMSAVAKAAPELGQYAVASEILQMQAVFVRENYPQHIDAFLEILEPFGLDVARKYGS